MASTKKKITVSQPEKQTKQTTLSNKKLFCIGGAILAVVLVISFAVPSIITRSKNKANEANKVIAQVEKILLLPEDSDPTVIEVSDVPRLKKANPDFYQDVAKGDYLLMYTGKAVIYRQSNNQIINVAPIVSEAKNEAD
jgi:hypothetical protein